MDLFGLGSFTGKGIYDVDAFEAATGETFPENHILSHDLIEGNYARCGLLSDTELFDDFPARYHAYARREHRWVRGDWQLLPWLGRRVPTPGGPRRRTRCRPWNAGSCFDNLRRSLVPPALVVLLVLGWTVLPGSPWLWTAIGPGRPGAAALQVVHRRRWSAASAPGRWRRLRVLAREPPGRGRAGRAGHRVPGRSGPARCCDAIVRTLVRLFVTRRKLLEWETAASTEQRLGTGLRDFIAEMWPAPALAVGDRRAGRRCCGPPRSGRRRRSWPPGSSRRWWRSGSAGPGGRVQSVLTEAERRALRRIAARPGISSRPSSATTTTGCRPDNFQEIPDGRSPTAPRRPTWACCCSRPWPPTTWATSAWATWSSGSRRRSTRSTGWRSTGATSTTGTTRGRFSRCRRYISTVDSGNLLGCLLALKQGLLEKAESADARAGGGRRAWPTRSA